MSPLKVLLHDHVHCALLVMQIYLNCCELDEVASVGMAKLLVKHIVYCPATFIFTYYLSNLYQIQHNFPYLQLICIHPIFPCLSIIFMAFQHYCVPSAFSYSPCILFYLHMHVSQTVPWPYNDLDFQHTSTSSSACIFLEDLRVPSTLSRPSNSPVLL